MPAPPNALSVWILNHAAAVTDGQSRAYDLGRHLVRQGHSVTIFAAGRNHYTGVEDRVYGRRPWCEEWIAGVRWMWLKTSADRTQRYRSMIGYGVRAAITGLMIRDRPSVVIGSCPHPLAGVAAWVIARARGARFYYEIRDLWPQSGVDQGLLAPRSPTTIILLMLEKFLISHADGVISVLPNLKEYLVRRGIEQPNLWIVPNGADLKSFAPVPRDSDRSEMFRVLYVGGFSNYHGLSVVLDAAELLCERERHDIRIEMIGEGPVKQSLMRNAAERGLANVRFGAHAPKSDLPEILGGGDVALFTFRRLPVLDYGISPLKVFDYMAAGRAVIFAASAFNNPVAEAGAGLSVDPEDPVALADAMERCADMPRAELEAMGSRGRQYLAAHHSMEVLGPRFEQALAGGAAS